MKKQGDTALMIRIAGLAILALFIVLAVAAYFSGRQVQRSSELITTDAVPGTIAAHKMRMDMSRSIGWVMVAASAQTTSSRDASLKIVHDADAAFNNDFKQYETTIKINPAADRVLLARVTSGYAKYYQQRLAYEALILVGNRDRSAAFLETNLVPAYVAVIDPAEELVKFNHGNSITYASYIHNSVHRLYWAVAVVMLLAFICAAVLVVNFAIRRREMEQLKMLKVSADKHFDGAFWMDANNQFIYVNDTACKVLGYAREELLGKPVTMIAPNATPQILKEVWKSLRETGFFTRESVHRRKDGSQFPIELVATYVRSGDKEFNCSFARDITERKRAQDELIWKTALLEAQVDSTLDGIMVVDTTGKRILQNRRFFELFNVPDAIASDEDHSKMLQHSVKLMKNPQQFTERVIHLYGHPNEIGRDELDLTDGRTLDRYSAPILDQAGKHFGRIWTFRDITEQKRAQEDIRATNERYARQEAALMELTRAYALRQASIADLKRKVIEIAAQTLAVERVGIWRYERDQQGIACQDQFELSKQSHAPGMVLRAENYPAYFRTLAEGNIIAAHDAYHDPRTAEFAVSYLRLHGISAMMDAPIHVIGSVTGVICFEHVGPARQWTADEQTFAIAIANVVSLLLADEERQQIEEQFRQSQKMEAVGQLASGVAHDFNNILAVILMQAELLKTEGNLSPVQKGFASEIGESAQRAAALTRQLLLFSRKEKMQPRELDLDKSINDMTKMLRRTIGENVRLQFKFSIQPLFVRADPGMLDQVLMNLAVNARDAMPEGGNLVIETSAVELDELSVATTPQSRLGTFACLSVSDTGAGIPPEIMPKIFEPFFTTKEVGKGTGLGLATVFGIVQQHQGWINVYSEVGHGTTFRIYLPRLVRNSAQKVDVPLPESAPRGDETILVVEDAPKLRASVIHILSRLGYNVLEAADGPGAIAAWKKHRAQVQLAKKVWGQHRDDIHLLLTDMVMPGGMTGKDLGEQLLQENPGLKVLYVSGYSADIANKDLPLAEGVNFLAKPFQAFKLAQTIRKLLNG